MTTEELTNVPGLAEDEVVVIKKLGFGSLNQLRSKAATADINPQSGQIRANMDLGEYMKWCVVFGVQEAPFFKNCRNFEERARVIDQDKIDSVTGEYVFQRIQKFNNFDGVDELKKK